MADRTARHLKAREAALLAELRARRSASEKQAALITGDGDEETAYEAYSGPLSTSERQARAALHSGAQRTDGTTSERQSRAARGIDPGEESDYDRKRRLIREAFNRSEG